MQYKMTSAANPAALLFAQAPASLTFDTSHAVPTLTETPSVPLATSRTDERPMPGWDELDVFDAIQFPNGEIARYDDTEETTAYRTDDGEVFPEDTIEVITAFYDKWDDLFAEDEVKQFEAVVCPECKVTLDVDAFPNHWDELHKHLVASQHDGAR